MLDGSGLSGKRETLLGILGTLNDIERSVTSNSGCNSAIVKSRAVASCGSISGNEDDAGVPLTILLVAVTVGSVTVDLTFGCSGRLVGGTTSAEATCTATLGVRTVVIFEMTVVTLLSVFAVLALDAAIAAEAAATVGSATPAEGSVSNCRLSHRLSHRRCLERHLRLGKSSLQYRRR